jgi:glutamine synthetase
VGALCLIAAESVDAGLTLPPEVSVDPVALAEEQQPLRLPGSVTATIDALEADAGLIAAMGEELLDAHVSVHRAEWDLLGARSDEEIAETVRWRY